LITGRNGMPRRLTTAALAVSLLALGSVSAIADEDRMSPLGDWSGFYFGGHAGYMTVDTSGYQMGIDLSNADSGSGDGGIFGAQLGYNIQAGEFLIGFEADGSLLSVNAPDLDLKDTYSADYDWFASLRGRMGIVHDNTLVYATGGLAFTRLDTTEPGSDFSSSSNGATGFAVGGGVEHMFAPQWSGRIEYLYASFNSITGVAAINSNDHDPMFKSDLHIIRAGVNFHF
jgi:outer membrane immunogenic protein